MLAFAYAYRQPEQATRRLLTHAHIHCGRTWVQAYIDNSDTPSQYDKDDESDCIPRDATSWSQLSTPASAPPSASHQVRVTSASQVSRPLSRPTSTATTPLASDTDVTETLRQVLQRAASLYPSASASLLHPRESPTPPSPEAAGAQRKGEAGAGVGTGAEGGVGWGGRGGRGATLTSNVDELLPPFVTSPGTPPRYSVPAPTSFPPIVASLSVLWQVLLVSTPPRALFRPRLFSAPSCKCVHSCGFGGPLVTSGRRRVAMRCRRIEASSRPMVSTRCARHAAL
jgi:hypothetical protein